ncbi:MAG: hypothetical protein EHM48_06015 [Planctomycetaceae bacterium]|nr:MAG: hypothetical protein EHM48_06015 [Planctomycetaceae bacterium]
MAENNHTHDEHDHEHDHDHAGEIGCCHHDHGHDDGGPLTSPGNIGGEHADTASKSLTEALRWSFGLLTVAMVVVIVLFLVSGFTVVKSQEIGVKKVFGAITETVGPGLAYTWPFPVGEIEVINIKPQTIRIDDFWLNETAQDMGKALRERMPAGEGLRPGWDGALFTGDRNLIHVKLDCYYTIDNVENFLKNIPRDSTYYTMDSVTHEIRIKEPLRSAICQAAVRSAARLTADSMQNNQGVFLEQVKIEAQKTLNDLNTGIKIDSVAIAPEGITWPLAARGAYEEAQNAKSQMESAINEAYTYARNTLSKAAGGNYKKLVGDPGKADAAAAGEDYNLIEQYNQARQDNDSVKAGEIVHRIDAVLADNNTGGQASKILSDATAESTRIKQSLIGRAREFDKIQAEYEKNPQLMLARLWAQARQDILSSPTAIKYYLNAGDGITNVKINHDPAMMNRIRQYLLEQESKDENKK